MSDRLPEPRFTDGALELALRHPSDTIKLLAGEVQASRKLIADLRALHRQSVSQHEMRWNGEQHKHVCVACDLLYPCPTIRLIEEAEL